MKDLKHCIYCCSKALSLKSGIGSIRGCDLDEWPLKVWITVLVPMDQKVMLFGDGRSFGQCDLVGGG